MSRLLPVLVADLADDAARDVLVKIAQSGGEAFVPLMIAPVGSERHLLEVYTPSTVGEPVVLLAEPIGAPTDKGFPLRLHPYQEEGATPPRGTAISVVDLEIDPDPDDAETQVYVRAPLKPKERPNVAARSHTPISLSAEHSAELAGLPITPPARDPLIGRVLGGGKLEIESVLGQGTMGTVYRARHRDLGIAIAVKVLKEAFQHDVDFCRRFYAEALTVSRLDHANVVRILDFGQEADGVLYLAMEFLDGRSLRAVVDDEAPVAATRVAALVRQVCAGLAQAHARGVVHRDVKPDNVMLIDARDDDGRPCETVKVCDFGLALLPTSEESKERFAGTPIYMSPEQIRGESLDGQSDVYACGVMMYELATGQPPFYDEDPRAVVAMHLRARPLPMSEIVREPDPRLAAVVEKAMAKAKEDRYPDVRALRTALKELLVPLGEPVPSASPMSMSMPAPAPVTFVPGEMRSPSSLRMEAVRVEQAEASPPPPESAPHSAKAAPSQRAAWLEDTSQQYARFLGGMATVHGGGARGEDIASSLARDPVKWLAKLAEGDARSFGHLVADLEGALRILAKRADARAMWAAASALHGIASDPSEAKKAELARPSLRLFADPAMLGPVAERLLANADDEQREPARKLVVQAGVAGAYALYGARVKLAANERVRIPFVETMRLLGDKCWPVVRASLERIPEEALTGEHAAAAALAEDLLLTVPMVHDEAAGHLAARYVKADGAGLCRAAARALARLWNERARPVLLALVADETDARRIAGMVGLRQLGAVDERSVGKLAPIARGEVETHPDVRIAAIAVLGVVADSAREATIPLLARLVRDVALDEAAVFEAARSLMALLGNEARAVVGDRAYQSADPLKSRLLALMEATKGGALVE